MSRPIDDPRRRRRHSGPAVARESFRDRLSAILPSSMHATMNAARDHGKVRRAHRRAEMRTGEMRRRKAGRGETRAAETEVTWRHSRAMMDRRRAAEDLDG